LKSGFTFELPKINKKQPFVFLPQIGLKNAPLTPKNQNPLLCRLCIGYPNVG
jgi:hypothetical protein